MENIKKKIEQGQVVWGTIIVSSSEVNVEISGYVGYDFTFIDTEHASAGPYGKEIESLIRAAYAADIFPLCRVVENNMAQIKKCLDFGTKGIIAPFINCKEDAEKLVDACLFPPKGNRGGCPGVRAQKYGSVPWFEFMEKSNQDLVIMPVIERMEAITNLEDILSVEGINAVLFGPFDLGIELGIRPKGNDVISETVAILTDSKIYEYMDYVIKTCKSNNVPVANIAWDVASAIEMVRRGCSIIGFTTDNNMFYQISKKYLDDARSEILTI